MSNYEDKFLDDIDYNIEKKKEDIFKDNEKLALLQERIQNQVFLHRPKLDDFRDIHDDVDSDIKEVKDIKSKIEEGIRTEDDRRVRNISNIFEGIVIDQSERSDWLGSNVEMYPTSEFDDVFAGVDAVAEFRGDGESEYLGLGIDVTLTSNIDTIKSKLNSIRGQISRGEISQLKYFSGDKEGKLTLPKVIVGADSDTVKELMNLWSSKKNREMSVHPFQVKMLLEIQTQLKGFKRYAKIKKNNEAEDSYDKALKIIESIIEEKSEIISKHSELISKDKVFSMISDYIQKELA